MDESFRQTSNAVLESDTRSVREVTLVEFPHGGAYTLGFVTTETPDLLAASADRGTADAAGPAPSGTTDSEPNYPAGRSEEGS